MRTGAPEAFILVFFRHGEVMQQAQGALVIGLAAVVGFGKKVTLKAQALGKARQHLHAQLPGAVFKIQHDAVKFRHHRLVGPEIVHVRQGDLEGFLLISRARGRAYLRHELPTGVKAFLQGEPCFLLVAQAEEGFGQLKGALHQFDVQAMVDQLEETDFGRGAPQLLGNLGAAVLEIAEIDQRNAALGFLAHAAKGGFQLQFFQAVFWCTCRGSCHLESPSSARVGARGGDREWGEGNRRRSQLWLISPVSSPRLPRRPTIN